MKIIYDEQGNNQDVSDEGAGVKQILNGIELELAIQKLPQKEQLIVKRVNEGYSYREIAKEMNISQSTIRGALDKIFDIIN